PPPPISHPPPYTTLFRSLLRAWRGRQSRVDFVSAVISHRRQRTNPLAHWSVIRRRVVHDGLRQLHDHDHQHARARHDDDRGHVIDRKSTRLNSSHSQISY